MDAPQKPSRRSALGSAAGGMLAGLLTGRAAVVLSNADATTWGIDRHTKDALACALLFAGILLGAGIGAGIGHLIRPK